MKSILCTLLLCGLTLGDVSHLKHNDGYLPPKDTDNADFQPPPGHTVNFKGMTIQRSQELHLGSFMGEQKQTFPTHTLAIPKTNKGFNQFEFSSVQEPESFKGDGYLPPVENVEVPEPVHPNPVTQPQRLYMPMPSWFNSEVMRNRALKINDNREPKSLALNKLVPQSILTSSGNGFAAPTSSGSSYVPPSSTLTSTGNGYIPPSSSGSSTLTATGNSYVPPSSSGSFTSGPSGNGFVTPTLKGNNYIPPSSSGSFTSAPSGNAFVALTSTGNSYVPPSSSAPSSNGFTSTGNSYVPPSSSANSYVPPKSSLENGNAGSSSQGLFEPVSNSLQSGSDSGASGPSYTAPSSEGSYETVSNNLPNDSNNGYLPPISSSGAHNEQSNNGYLPPISNPVATFPSIVSKIPKPSILKQFSPKKTIKKPLTTSNTVNDLNNSISPIIETSIAPNHQQQPFNDIESHDNGYEYTKEVHTKFEEGQDQFRTIQVYNKNSKKFNAYKVVEKPEKNGLKTIKILGKTRKAPPKENYIRTVQIVNGKDNKPVQTVKIFNDSKNKGYLPPSESYYF